MAEVIVAPNGVGSGYGSHQPALRGLARFTKICSVIEFGAGTYSTHLFLDREAFPCLETLVTVESSPEWAEKVRTNDPRHKMTVMPPERFSDFTKEMRADFVFLDCAPNGIRHSLKGQALTMAPIVGIHDSGESDVEAKYVKAFGGNVLTVFFSNIVDLSEIELLYTKKHPVEEEPERP